MFDQKITNKSEFFRNMINLGVKVLEDKNQFRRVNEFFRRVNFSFVEETVY